MRKLAVMLLLVLAGCGDEGGGFEAPAGSQAEPLTARSFALADATARDGSYARYPQGALGTLEVKTQQVGWNRASYLRFDIQDMPATGGSATLYLYGSFLGSGPACGFGRVPSAIRRGARAPSTGTTHLPGIAEPSRPRS